MKSQSDIHKLNDIFSENQKNPFLWSNFVTVADEIESLFLYGPSVTAILGEFGIGKTRMLDYLQDGSEQVQIVRIDGNPLLSIEQVLASILQQIEQYDTTFEVEEVAKKLQQTATTNPVVILIDDAHHLSLEVTKALLMLIGKVDLTPEYPIRLIGCYENKFSDKLMLEQTGIIADNALYKLSLNGFSESELKGFIGHQLNLSETEVEERFSEKKLEKLWAACSGNSRKLLDALYLVETQVEEKKSEQTVPEQAGSKQTLYFRVALAILGVGLLLIAFWGSWKPSQTKEPAVITTEADSELIEVIKGAESEKKTSEDAEVATEISQAENTELTPGTQTQMPATEINLENLTSQVKGEPDNKVIEKEVIANDLNGVLIENTAKSNSGQEEVIPITEQDVNNISEASEEPTVVDKIEKEVLEIVGAETENAINNKEQSNKEDTTIQIFQLTEGEKWLMERDPNHYTIQLLGLSNEAEMKQFIEKLAINDSVYYFQTQLNSKPLFILVTGDYPDQSTAIAALKKLPAQLLKSKPWVKSLGIVQSQITRTE